MSKGVGNYRGVQNLLYKRHGKGMEQGQDSNTKLLSSNPDGVNNYGSDSSVIYAEASRHDEQEESSIHSRVEPSVDRDGKYEAYSRARKPTVYQGMKDQIRAVRSGAEMPQEKPRAELNHAIAIAPPEPSVNGQLKTQREQFDEVFEVESNLEENFEDELADGEIKAVSQQQKEGELIALLISYDDSPHGKVFELRKGRWIITSQASNEFDYILINDDSISTLHAIVRASGHGKVQVLDQLSEFGSGVTPAGKTTEESCEGVLVSVGHGDVLRLGKKRYLVCMVPSIKK